MPAEGEVDFMNGLKFERRVITHLNGLECGIETSDRLDHVEKVDFRIVCVAGKRLSRPVDVQLTQHEDSLTKLANFVRCARSQVRRGAAALYAEVERGTKPAVAATAVKSEAIFVSEGGLDSDALAYAVRIAEDGTARPFDACAKIAELLQLASPSFSAAERKKGMIVDVNEHGAVILSSDGCLYAAVVPDIADIGIVRSVREHQAGGRSAYALIVSFIPGKSGTPHPAARSVVNACAEAIVYPSFT